MMEFKHDSTVWELYEMAFLKREGEELFDLRKDPYQLNNVARDPAYRETKAELKQQLQEYLIANGDPRALGEEVSWDEDPYYKDADWVGRPRKEAQQKFGLQPEYSYR